MLAEYSIDDITDDRECLMVDEGYTSGPDHPDIAVSLPDGASGQAEDGILTPDDSADEAFGALADSEQDTDLLTAARQNVAAAYADEPIEASTDTDDPAAERRPDGAEIAEEDRDESADASADEGGSPPDEPGDANEMSDDDNGELPKRERRDERTLPDDERERITAIGKAHIHHEVQDSDVHVLSLPDGNRSTYQVVEGDAGRTAINWRIDINEAQKNLGIGRRLAKETADDLIRQDIDTLAFDIDSEATLRTAYTVFDHHVTYSSPDVDTTLTTPQQVLDTINSSDAEAPARVHATVAMRSFFAHDAAYHTTDGERVIDRCDFANAQADESGMYGEVHAFRQRVLSLPEPHATNTTLAFNELLANYNAHVLPVNPGERYEVRTSWVRDPDTGQDHIRLTNYFFGDVRPGLVDEINYSFSEIGSEEAFYGESREAQGASVDPEDIDAARALEEQGEETTAQLQQSGRGLATIKRVCTRAMAVGFPGGGGGFVLDIKDVEVARKAFGPENQSAPREDEVDDLINKFLEDFPDE